MTFPNPPHDPAIQQAFTLGTLLGGLGPAFGTQGNKGTAPFDTPLAQAMREMREQTLKGMAAIKPKVVYPMRTRGTPLLDKRPCKRSIDDALFCHACVERNLLAGVLL